MGQNSAARAEGQTIHMVFLRIILAGVVDLPARGRFVAQRQPCNAGWFSIVL